MSRIIYIIILGIIISHYSLQSQNTTFDHVFTNPLNEVVKDIYEADNGDIFIAGFRSKANEFWGKTSGLLYKLDKEGNILDSLIQPVSNRRYCFEHIIPLQEDSLLLLGYTSDTIREYIGCNNCQLTFQKITNTFDSVSSKSYAIPSSYQWAYSRTAKGLNDITLIGITYMIDYQFKFMFYVLTPELDSIIARDYSDMPRCCGPIKHLKDSTYWICDENRYNYYCLNNELILTEYITARPHNLDSPMGLKWDTDTSFYMTGEWNGGNEHDIGLYKQIHPIDSTNSIFKSWGTDKLDIPALSAIDFRHKDSIFTGGTSPYWFYYGNFASWYYVLQTDSNLNIRWERFYGGDAYYMMQKIVASNDGGCIIAGTRYDYQNTSEEELDIHILKLNSEGLLVGTAEEPTIEMREALVFPNPGTNHLKVRIAAHYKESIFELYDIGGKIVLSEQIIGKWGEVNTVALKSGTYVYRIYNEEGLFESGKWLKQ